MRERIARAMYGRNAMYEQPQDWEGAPVGEAFPIPWDDLPEHGHPELHAEWLADVDAVLAAMREPTPEMIQSRIDRYPTELRIRDSDLETWRDMIDAARAPSS